MLSDLDRPKRYNLLDDTVEPFVSSFSSSSELLSSETKTEGDVSFNGSCGDVIDTSGVFVTISGVESSSFEGVDGVGGFVSPVGGTLLINGSDACRAGVLVVIVVVLVCFILCEKVLSRDPSDDDTLWFPVTVS